MADLGMLADFADILSGAAVVGGAAFAVIQLREYRTQRRENAAAELVRSFYNPEFARSVRLMEVLDFHPELAQELTRQDRVHTYAGFHIADIRS